MVLFTLLWLFTNVGEDTTIHIKHMTVDGIRSVCDKIARFKMFGSASCDFAYFASGRTDCHIRFVRKLWDFLPGLLISIEAGGIYDRDLYDGHRLLIMCSSERALKEISDILRTMF